MKKIALICLLLMGKLTFSQTFSILDSAGTTDVSGALVVVPITANNSYVTNFKIKNKTANVINYKVDRVYLTPPICSGNDIYYCAAGQCFPPDTSVTYSSTADVIQANQTLPSDPTNFGIQADYLVGANCCSEDVLYKVYNANNTSDFTIVTIRYQCPTGIDEDAVASVGAISSAYPNPANTFVSIKYMLNESAKNGKIVLHDISGKLVKEVSLENKQGIVKIDVSNINSGVYFYSFIVDEKTIATRKLIITSK